MKIACIGSTAKLCNFSIEWHHVMLFCVTGESIHLLAASKQGSYIASANHSSEVIVYDVNTLQVLLQSFWF